MSFSSLTLTITVVIPAFNSANFIGETLDSVLSQTYRPIEILVIDDGSTDDTVDVTRSFGDRIRILQQFHQGVSAARNLGIRQARGDYIAFVDSDDLWKPNKLEKQAVCLEEKNIAWVCCLAGYFDSQSGRKLSGYSNLLFEGDVLEKEFLHRFILSPTPVVKRSIFDEVGFFNESIRIGEDWDMWLRIAARYPLGVVDEELAMKREHPQSTMQNTSIDEKLNAELMVAKMAVDREPARLGSLLKQLTVRIYLERGIELVKRGEYQQARLYMAQAHRHAPGSLKLAAYRLALSLSNKNADRLLKLVRLSLGIRTEQKPRL